MNLKVKRVKEDRRNLLFDASHHFLQREQPTDVAVIGMCKVVEYVNDRCVIDVSIARFPRGEQTVEKHNVGVLI